MSLQIEALSPIMWTIIIAVALVLIAAVVFTWKSSAMSTPVSYTHLTLPTKA